MVFSPCRNHKSSSTDDDTTTKTSNRHNKLSSLFCSHSNNQECRRNLAYISTDQDQEDGDNGGGPPDTLQEINKFQSVRRNKSERRTLLSRDGFAFFSGSFHGKRTRDTKKKRRGEKCKNEENNDGEELDGVTTNNTPLFEGVKRIDPVKSGFMAKKSDRDEDMACAAGRLVSAQWANKAGRKPPSRPYDLGLMHNIENKDCVVADGGFNYSSSTRKGGGCSPIFGVNDSFVTAATIDTTLGCDDNPVSVSSGNHHKLLEGTDDDVLMEEFGWCDVFNTSTLTEEIDKETIGPGAFEHDGNEAAANTSDEPVWCNVFDSVSILPEEEEEVEKAPTNAVDCSNVDELPSREKKERGIQNVEIVYSAKEKKMNRSIIKMLSSKCSSKLLTKQ